MLRRDMIKTACGIGLCGCVQSFAADPSSPESPKHQQTTKELKRAQWWLDHGKNKPTNSS